MQKTLLISVFVVLISAAGALAQPWDGSGTQGDPYQITDANDLNALAADPNYYDAHFILTADIDLTGNTYTTAVIAPDELHGNFGFDGTAFTGVFDGNNHIISNLTIDTGGAADRRYLGLFGLISGGGVVKNLGIENINITGGNNSYYLGGMAGSNGGTISKCYTTGSVTGNNSYYLGGMAGSNGGTITNCYATGSATGGWRYLGGLVGRNYDGTIINCYSTGLVSGNNEVGGLVGNSNTQGTNSFWDTETSGTYISDAGEGKTTAQMYNVNTFISWATTPAVWTIDDGIDYPHLAWEQENGEPIEHPSLSDFISGTGQEMDPFLIYDANDLSLVGQYYNDWDKHFKLMADIDLSGYAYTTAVIANTIGGNAHTDPKFAGAFNGSGFTIRNLTINTSSSYLGLFGYLDTAANISNLGIENVNILGGRYLGGLVGRNSGTITNCHSTGTVSGGYSSHNLGGLVGVNDNGTISNCFSIGSVTAGDDSYPLGGLVGRNSGTITNCYATGSVSGGCFYSHYLGGLAGDNGGSISNCYASGQVSGDNHVGGLVGRNQGSINDSFWNTETISGLGNMCGSESGGGSGCDNNNGKTTAEMKQQATFDPPWDFVNPWGIFENLTYPLLRSSNLCVQKTLYPSGDINKDCRVNMYDLAEMATNWLDDGNW